DGHTVTGTAWNYNGPIDCASSGLNNTQITAIFNRVAEDFRPFNVNVTTDSTKYLSAPANRRMRVINTITYEWYGSAGGVAFVNSFTWGDDSPCFVFTERLNYNPKNIAEACSHEAGHTLNLQHQSVYDASCQKTAEYHTGVGIGEIGWAPIMGAGYYQNMTLWNSGKSSMHCDSIQNDLTVITGSNGFGFRNDDHVSTFAGATPAPFISNHFDINGIITQSTDQDMITFTQAQNGRFQLSAVPYNVGTGNSGSNLDLQVSLYNSSQILLNVYNPGTLLSSVIDTLLNSGTYYLRIEGRGNVYAPNYASLGSYALTADFTVSTLPLRKLELSGELVGDQHMLHWIIDADENVTSQVLEVSTDGRNFTPLIQSGTNDRNYSYKPTLTTSVQYRLNVMFDNGHRYYSNIVQIRNNPVVTGPKLAGNVAGSNVTVHSPGAFSYSIFEMGGRMVSRGQLSNGINTVNTGALNKGLYIVRFSNGFEYWTEKFIRQ
ncbi:MAG: T9SS type A sorting domain-containing protein, partial [Flavitalea sp.]